MYIASPLWTLSHEIHSSSWRYRKVANPAMSTYVTGSFHNSENPHVYLWVRHWVTNYIPQNEDIGRLLIPRCLHKWQVHFITVKTPILSHELHSSNWRYRKVANPTMSTYATCSFHHSQNHQVCLWVRHWVTNHIPQNEDIGRLLITRCLHKRQVHFITVKTPMCVRQSDIESRITFLKLEIWEGR